MDFKTLLCHEQRGVLICFTSTKQGGLEMAFCEEVRRETDFYWEGRFFDAYYFLKYDVACSGEFL